MKLYKFRPLANDKDLKRVLKIIKKGEFWCSKLWDLNDPMEGVYKTISYNNENIQKIFSEKNKFVICSFSGINALKNPLLWGYYANGFRGVAIEVEVDENKKITPVKYESKPIFTSDLGAVEKIITTKLDLWEEEDEYRFLEESPKEGLFRVGRVTKVFFGSPYSGVCNLEDVEKNSLSLLKYNYLKKVLMSKCTQYNIEYENIDIHYQNKD